MPTTWVSPEGPFPAVVPGDIRFPVLKASALTRPGLRNQSSMNLAPLSPSAVDIQSHLYQSFLQGSTADVALRIHGTWDAVYNLHRVVLIQSGFFRSLFTSGFIESSPRLGINGGLHEIVVQFDDHNITRAAFEICISRLYGGGPPLHITPSLIPSTSEPLTPSFPFTDEWPKTPENHHPATPRLLLSLLATAVYLSVPSLASQAMSSILSTIGPHTVLKYLNFSLGKYIGDTEPTGDPDTAVGLEHVAQSIDENKSSRGSIASLQSTKGKENRTVPSQSNLKGGSQTDSSLSPSSTSYGSTSDDESDRHSADESLMHYGAISDKIGEACACWLARWGADLLEYELKENDKEDSGTSTPMVSRKRAKTIPSDFSSGSPVPTEIYKGRTSVPLIWSRGGLNAKWVAAIISADTFFVRGERERYSFARSVVELRRRDGIIEAEEQEWTRLFEQGIFYANMSMEEIINISKDISPTTKRPFVPISVLQAAHWAQSVLRNHIITGPSLGGLSVPSLTPPTSSPRDKELGISQTTADILAHITTINSDAEKTKAYFPVPTDSSLRIGDNGSSFNATPDGAALSMDQLFTSMHSSNLPLPPASPTASRSNPTLNPKTPTSESDFFGLLPPRYTASSCILSDPSGKSKWSPYPPYRFAVEFWDLDSLKEKSRLHSHTICYAGSLFNVYVQVVRKKGQVQLGIYLHRQSSIDPIPASSAPSSLVFNRGDRFSGPSPGNVSAFHNRHPSLPSAPSTPSNTSHYSPSIYPSSRSTTPISYNTPTSPAISPTSGSPSSPSVMNSNTLPATAPPVTPPQPYRDPRPAISAYFTISCASATGSSQTRFTSSPDIFSVSQSWGWKSSSLRTEEYMDIKADGSGGTPAKKEVSLRATVVLGLV